nr:NTP transferase domain-containing protein [candidate division Zixibacteria bacterium]
MTEKKAAVILAAGKGKRMKSDLPKVLHGIKGKPMIRHLMETITDTDWDRIIIVVGHQGDLVIEELRDFNVEFVWQKEQLGTGHAVLMARPNLIDFKGTVLVAAGDVPFLSLDSISGLIKVHHKNGAAATCLSVSFDNPRGYGRIIRRPGTDILLDIVEDKDASEDIKKIREVNSGTFCFDCRSLFDSLEKIGNENAQREYYLTDTIKILQAAGKPCAVYEISDPLEVTGVNSVEQLLALEREFKKD